MSKKYCVCGKPNELLANFCMGCGKPFSNLTSNAKTTEEPRQSQPKPSFSRNIPKPTLKRPPQRVIADDIDDEDDEVSGTDDIIETVPEINGLSVEITMPKENKLTVGALASSGGGTPSPVSPSTKIKINKKQILNEYRQEAGSLRPKK